MINCRLKVLLAEKRITQLELSAATGISRVTLSTLANNRAKGIQYHTLERICDYLHCSVGDIFVYQCEEKAARP